MNGRIWRIHESSYDTVCILILQLPCIYHPARINTSFSYVVFGIGLLNY